MLLDSLRVFSFRASVGPLSSHSLSTYYVLGTKFAPESVAVNRGHPCSKGSCSSRALPFKKKIYFKRAFWSSPKNELPFPVWNLMGILSIWSSASLRCLTCLGWSHCSADLLAGLFCIKNVFHSQNCPTAGPSATGVDAPLRSCRFASESGCTWTHTGHIISVFPRAWPGSVPGSVEPGLKEEPVCCCVFTPATPPHIPYSHPSRPWAVPWSSGCSQSPWRL